MSRGGLKRCLDGEVDDGSVVNDGEEARNKRPQRNDILKSISPGQAFMGKGNVESEGR